MISRLENLTLSSRYCPVPQTRRNNWGCDHPRLSVDTVCRLLLGTHDSAGPVREDANAFDASGDHYGWLGLLCTTRHESAFGVS